VKARTAGARRAGTSVDDGADARTVGQRCGDHTVRSHPDEGVVTEIGQDVAGVSDDLAGLG